MIMQYYYIPSGGKILNELAPSGLVFYAPIMGRPRCIWLVPFDTPAFDASLFGDE